MQKSPYASAGSHHLGIVGNKCAGSLAHSALVSRWLHLTTTSSSDHYPTFQSFLFNYWQSFESDLSNKKISHSVLPWSDLYNQNRLWETSLTHLHIGHTNLIYSHLKTHFSTFLCPTRNITVSAHCILLSCPCYTVPSLQLSLI